jgi:phage tail protein X
MVSALPKITIAEPVRLDILAAETMGTEKNGALEALLAANPGLAEEGPYLAAPRKLAIPPTPQKPPAPSINPWD